jgi:hypothetical protein
MPLAFSLACLEIDGIAWGSDGPTVIYQSQMHPVHCPAPATGAAVRAGHLLRWVAPAQTAVGALTSWGTQVLAVGALASTTCNNFIADLLFLLFA